MAKYYLVEESALPEIFNRVTQAKELLETGEAATVAEAVARVGISRSAFYKYKDAISRFNDMKRGRIVTFQTLLRDKKGVLSAFLSIFSGTGANVLTINQSLPTNGVAVTTISVDTAGMEPTTEELLAKLAAAEGVIKIEVVAG